MLSDACRDCLILGAPKPMSDFPEQVEIEFGDVNL